MVCRPDGGKHVVIRCVADILWSLFADILSKEVDCTEIQFREDGSWRALSSDGDEYFIPDSPSAKTTDDAAATSETTTGKFQFETF